MNIINIIKLEKPIDRVRIIIDSKRLSVSAFEKVIGMSNNSIQQALKRGANLKDETLNNILNAYPEISAQWLLTGKGSMNTSDSISSEPKTHESKGKYISKETIEILDKLSKSDIIKYMELKQKDFEKYSEFQLYKKLLTKDDVIAELIEKLRER